MLKDIRSLSYDELSEEILNLGFPKFRINQIFSWVHEKSVSSFDEMTNISKDMRQKLSEYFYFDNISINTKLVSKIDDTVKYLFTLSDGEYVDLSFPYKLPNTSNRIIFADLDADIQEIIIMQNQPKLPESPDVETNGDDQ